MATITEGTDHRIDGFSIFTLIVFFAVNILVIFPIYIPIPRPVSRAARKLAVRLRILSPELPALSSTPSDERDKPTTAGKAAAERDANGNSGGSGDAASSAGSAKKTSTEDERAAFPISLTTAPVIGVLLLLASTSIPGRVVREGIVGSQGVRPYDIMTLFLSLAYISLSLDCTGLLRFLAFWVAQKGGTSGRRLYLYLYLFFFGSGVLVGNDPIILSGTSFLAYFSRIAGISPPRAWIFAQFASCNVASAVLVSSNPTNLVLTGAYDISFLVYSAWLVLPVLATAVCLFPWLVWGQFNDEALVPRKLEPPGVKPSSALIDRHGAIFGSVLLGITLVALVALSAVGLLHGVQGVWTVTAPAAIVMLCRDVWYDLSRWQKTPRGPVDAQADEVDGRPEVQDQGQHDLDGVQGRAEDGLGSKGEQHPMKVLGAKEDATDGDIGTSKPGLDGEGEGQTGKTSSAASQSTAVAAAPSGPPSPPATPPIDRDTARAARRPRTAQSLVHSFSHHFPTFTHVFVRLPLPLLPFAFSMFILVESLQWTGWIRVWAGWWTAWVRVGGLAGAIWLMACLSVLGCNAFGTNIGATILLSRILQQWSGNGPVSQRILTGSLYTLALGSNYGAFSYTFSASLAGLLWKEILLQKHIKVGRWEFMKNNIVSVFLCMVVGCLVVAAEVCIML